MIWLVLGGAQDWIELHLKEEKDAHNHNVCLACCNRLNQLEITISACMITGTAILQTAHTYTELYKLTLPIIKNFLHFSKNIILYDLKAVFLIGMDK